MLGEAADDAHPLRRRRRRNLPLQHCHRVGERTHAVPAQLHVEIEAAANDVKMIVDEPGKHAPAFQVDDPGLARGKRHDVRVATDRGKDAIFDGDSARRRIGAIERGEKATMKDEIGRLVGTGHERVSGGGAATGSVSCFA